MKAPLVEDAGLDLPNGHRARGLDALELDLALGRREELRVVDPLAIEPVGKDDRRRHERAGERASARLVGPGDPAEALGAQRSFIAIELRR